MKKLLLAGVGVVALSAAAPATAADLPVAMPAKAPAYVAPLYNWTGFYIGGHLGWARVDLTETITAAPAGFPVGSFGGSEDGFIGGGQMGFNYQFGQWVIGVEGQLSGTDIGSSGTIAGFVGAVPVAITGSTNVEWIATLAARLGVAVNNWLIYGKVGGAWLDWSANAAASVAGFTVATASGGDTESGWMVGAGIEYGFTPNWSAKIEYNYLDFDDQTIVAGGLVSNVDLRTHLVKAGINYRFGPW